MADPALDSQIVALLRERRKIEAIKLLRERTGVGLKEAKDEVDRIAQRPEVAAELASLPATAGSTAAFWLLLIIAGAVIWWFTSRP
jgi:hypothetical protein